MFFITGGAEVFFEVHGVHLKKLQELCVFQVSSVVLFPALERLTTLQGKELQKIQIILIYLRFNRVFEILKISKYAWFTEILFFIFVLLRKSFFFA